MMIAIMTLKVLTSIVIALVAIASAWYAPKQKTALDRAFFFSFAMFLAWGIIFMWV